MLVGARVRNDEENEESERHLTHSRADRKKCRRLVVLGLLKHCAKSETSVLSQVSAVENFGFQAYLFLHFRRSLYGRLGRRLRQWTRRQMGVVPHRSPDPHVQLGSLAAVGRRPALHVHRGGFPRLPVGGLPLRLPDDFPVRARRQPRLVLEEEEAEEEAENGLWNHHGPEGQGEEESGKTIQ